MPLPVILQKGQILLTQTTSWRDITFPNNPFLFGEVVGVSDLSDGRYKDEDVVAYNGQGAVLFSDSGDNYILTTEDKVVFKQDPGT